jgi:AcrR family transcriptional regulator
VADDHSTAPLKRCTKCGTDKPATSEFFHAYARSPDGRRSVCRECRAADHAEHREERLPKRREHYEANKDRLQAAVRGYYRENADALRKGALARHHRNRDARLDQMRAYRAENRETLLEKQRARSNEEFRRRYGTDSEFTLRHRVRSLLRATIKHGRDGRRTEELLGYTMQELRAHIELQFTKGMSWYGVLRGEIEIDHIRPVASFSITSYDDPDFLVCWGLPNLRPMWARENRSKGDKLLTLL